MNWHVNIRITKMRALVTEYSQEHMLREQLGELGVKHNQPVVVTIENIRIDTQAAIYFCDSQVRIISRVNAGDSEPLPYGVSLKTDFDFPKAGYYRLENVNIIANGTIALSCQDNTCITAMEPKFA